ncbi:MAG: protein-glutamate O-methyltransferase CheR [Clostridiaceae bacterium]|nr:protein-glutamate O-methyltransferase CheR [Clostridiaceae bacterium]
MMKNVAPAPFGEAKQFSLTDAEYRKLAGFIKQNYGINLKEEKRALLAGRLQNLLLVSGMQSFTDYYNYLVSDRSGTAEVDLINRITTNHTFFMRESDHFEYFQKNVLPILEKSVSNRDLRIWCAACSTGEESYTLAMLIDEYFGIKKVGWDSKVLATDISEKALIDAKRGVYDAERVAPLPPHWRMNYFTPFQENTYRVADRIKNEVIYRKFNLMDKHFPFKKKFHSIFCRNAMIYFDDETKYDLVDKFYACTEQGGYLFIGHSETLDKSRTGYRYVMPSVYVKE